MSLYLVQHGESLTKEQDPERGLSEAGTATVKSIAVRAQQAGLRVTRIRHSGKQRAAQTAALFAAALQPVQGVDRQEGMDPKDDVEAFAARLGAARQELLVGHLPFMARLASFLLTGSPDHPVFRFQNGGVLCLDQDAEGNWSITGAIMPVVK